MYKDVVRNHMQEENIPMITFRVKQKCYGDWALQPKLKSEIV